MPNESTTRTAVVVGATGIIGRAIAAKLAGLGGWRVLGVTRSGGTVPGVDEAIAVDLTGFATGNPMNLALSVAIYASLLRESGLRLNFPGSAAAFGAMTQVVDAEQLAEAAAWAAVTPQAAGEVFNVANGDPTRWSHLWPAFGDYFGIPAGGPRPIPLSSFMPELAPVWRDMAAKYGLDQPELGSLVNWGFLEFMFAIEYDIVLALGKIRRAGFTRHPDTTEGFFKRFDEYRRARIIPTF